MGFMIVTCGRSGTPGVVRQTRLTSMREDCSKLAGGSEPHALKTRANPIATASFNSGGMTSPEKAAELIFHYRALPKYRARLNLAE
jgi:hypothetical protein